MDVRDKQAYHIFCRYRAQQTREQLIRNDRYIYCVARNLDQISRILKTQESKQCFLKSETFLQVYTKLKSSSESYKRNSFNDITTYEVTNPTTNTFEIFDIQILGISYEG